MSKVKVMVYAVETRMHRSDWEGIKAGEIFATEALAQEWAADWAKRCGYSFEYALDYIRVVPIEVKTDFTRWVCPSD